MNYPKQVFLVVVLLAGWLPFSSCNYSNVRDEEERTVAVSDFSKIRVKGSFNILLEQGSEPGLLIRGLRESLETVNVVNDTVLGQLELSRDKLSLSSPDLIIRFTQLDELRIEGGATVNSNGYLNLKKISIGVEGGARVNLSLKATEIHLRGEGGVVYELRGVAPRLESNLFGVAYLNAGDLLTDTVRIRVEGVGVASLHVNKFLKADLEGMGRITYSGDAELEQSVQGLGKISRE